MIVAKRFKSLLLSIFDFVPVKIHWLFWCTLSLIAGICWYSNHSVLLLIFGLVSALALLFLQGCRRALLVCFCFFLGFLRPYLINNNYMHVKKIMDNNTLTGTALLVNTEHTKNKYYKYRVSLKLISVHTISNKVACLTNKIIQVYMPKKIEATLADTVFINSLLIKSGNNNNYSGYLMKEGIAATAFVQKLDYKLLYRPDFSLARAVHLLRENLKNRLQKKMSAPTAALFVSIFLGLTSHKSESLNQKIKEKLSYWGTLHYLARSGLHLVLIIIFLSFFLRCVPCHFVVKQSLILVLVGVYALLTWPSISFMRSMLTIVIYQSCIYKNLPVHGLQVITLVCFVLLVYNPFYLFFLDFQLSFAFTFALAWFNELKLLSIVKRFQ
jgi:competence protein ComEC